MKKDPTEFRDRFAKWKAGEKVYEAGLPKYGGGKGDIDFHDDVTKHIIQKEGVLTAPTDIGDGKITIGSGLTQQKYIDQYKRNGNKWSQKENYIAVKDTVRGFENSLRGILPEYDQYPAEMRKALIDIIYNIGEGGLKNSPKFLSAMKLHNWNEAKRQMDWDNSDPLFGNGARRRNAERAALFDAGLAHWSPAGPVEQMMDNSPRFVPQPVIVPATTQPDYSIQTMVDKSIPAMLNSRNNGSSPLYGGNDFSFRMPSIREYVERNLMRPQW